MKKKGKKVQEYHSIEEFNKRFFPESFNEQLSKIDDPHTFGVKLAEESLKKIMSKLSKK